MNGQAPARVDHRLTDTRARIEAMALKLFTTKGFTATSLRDIAEALGLTKAALYYHFPAKADLARSIFEPFINDVDDLLAKATGRDLPPRQLLGALFDALAPQRPVFTALVRDASALAHVDVEGASVGWVERFQDMLVGPDATPAQQVRAVVAIGGLSRAIALTDIPLEVVRAAAIDAAVAAMGVDEANH